MRIRYKVPTDNPNDVRFGRWRSSSPRAKRALEEATHLAHALRTMRVELRRTRALGYRESLMTTIDILGEKMAALTFPAGLL